MKKLIAAILATLLLLSFASCAVDEMESSSELSALSSEESYISDETTEETSEELQEESNVSVDEPVEDLPENALFGVEPYTTAIISAGHKDEVRIFHSENGDFYTVSAIYSGRRHLCDTNLSTKEGVADGLANFVWQPCYKSIVDSPEPLAAYGLDSDENATAVITLDGWSVSAGKIRIGNKTEDGYFAICTDEEGNYNDTVYVVDDAVGLAAKPIEYFVDGMYGTWNFSVSDIFFYTDHIWIESEDEKLAFTYLTPEERANHTVEDAWKLTSPDTYIPAGAEYALCNSYAMSGMLYKLFTLKTENVFIALPEEGDMEKYGLDKPYRRYVAFIRSSAVYVYLTEPDENGDMYIGGERIDGGGDSYSTTYFPISVINVEDFHYASYDAYDFVDNRLVAYDLKDITKMTVEMDGKSHLIDFAVDTNGYRYSRFDGVSGEYDNTDKFYYRGIYNARINSIYTGDFPTKFDISVTVNCGGKDTRLDFKYNNDETGVCVVNGKNAYNIGVEYDTLCEMLEIMLKGEFIPD